MPNFAIAKTQPTATTRFAITLEDDNTTGEHLQSIRYDATIRLSNGADHHERGDLTPYLTSDQVKAVTDLLNTFTAKASAEMITPDKETL